MQPGTEYILYYSFGLRDKENLYTIKDELKQSFMFIEAIERPHDPATGATVTLYHSDTPEMEGEPLRRKYLLIKRTREGYESLTLYASLKLMTTGIFPTALNAKQVSKYFSTVTVSRYEPKSN